MNISKKQLIIILAGIIAIGGLIASRYLRKKSTALYTVAILKTASHPSLDQAQQGLIDELNSRLGDKVDYSIHNAQGNVATMHMVAQQLHANKKIDAIYAIATPALQAIATIEKEKPIILAAVTDPTSLGIIQAKSNVCGVTDMINMKREVEMMRTVLPHVKTIALVYSSAEANSLKQIQLLKNELAPYNIQTIDISVLQESDVPTAMNMACRKADAIITPSDNIIACSMELVAAITLQNKKPLIACYNQAVKQGALAACGVDYYQCGLQAGKYAYEILVNAKKPYEIGITLPVSDTIYLNSKTLKALELEIPATLKDAITIIN